MRCQDVLIPLPMPHSTREYGFVVTKSKGHAEMQDLPQQENDDSSMFVDPAVQDPFAPVAPRTNPSPTPGKTVIEISMQAAPLGLAPILLCGQKGRFFGVG